MSDRQLHHLAAVWQAHAESDPLWAVLSEAGREGRGWDVDAFFATGAREVRELERRLRATGLPTRYRRALDFGCGVGRVSEALTRLADEVVGVDVAPTMVELARALSLASGRVTYRLNRSADLSGLESGSFDLVYSKIVLQHVGVDLALGYLSEMARLLAPGGALVVQLPARPRVEAAPAPWDAALYRARITAEHPPRIVAAGSVVDLALQVANASGHDWLPPGESLPHVLLLGDGSRRPSFVGQVTAGNRWLDEHGRVVVQDDGREVLPFIRTNEALPVTLTVSAPESAGSYQLELDCVHEGITWFADAGSAPLRLPVTVTGAPRPPDPSRAERWQQLTAALSGGRPVAHPPAYDVVGVPRRQVEQSLECARLELRAVDPDWSAGWDWESWVFVAVRPVAERSPARRPSLESSPG